MLTGIVMGCGLWSVEDKSWKRVGGGGGGGGGG